MSNGPRLSKDEYYLAIAKAVCLRSPCVRRQFGAIIVRDDAVVSTGYNGPARGVVNCEDVGCVKNQRDLPHYAGYDDCPGVHAEENCVINAARHGASVFRGTLYLFGRNFGDDTPIEGKPCDRCKRAIINAGIVRVVTVTGEGGVAVHDVKDWIKEDTENYKKKLNKAKKGD